MESGVVWVRLGEADYGVGGLVREWGLLVKV